MTRASRPLSANDVPLQLAGRITIGSSYVEDVHTGAVGWSHWQQITLDRPISTVADPKGYEDAEKNVRAMQPIWPGSRQPLVFTWQHLTVTGKLFHADNGNQMTAVLIEVDKIVPGHQGPRPPLALRRPPW